MARIEGQLISGTFDEEEKVYTLEQVKHVTTKTVLQEEQLETLCSYLENCQNTGSQILTLNDQILLPLSGEELAILLHDLKAIQHFYHS